MQFFCLDRNRRATGGNVKSAYELAMARLEKTQPAIRLTADQKARLAEVDSEIDARIAERRIFLEGQLAKASEGEREQIRRELASELARLEEKREAKKEKIRAEAAA